MRGSKWSRVDDATRIEAMAAYLAGNESTKNIANRFGFNERRIRQWFLDAGRLAEFEAKFKSNISDRARHNKPMVTKYKLSGSKNLRFKDGFKFEIKYGNLVGIKNRRTGQYLHREVIERQLGRKLLVSEVVHHINLNPADNRLENLLLLCNSREHGLLHQLLQCALVQMLSEEELRMLSEHILNVIRKEVGGE